MPQLTPEGADYVIGYLGHHKTPTVDHSFTWVDADGRAVLSVDTRQWSAAADNAVVAEVAALVAAGANATTPGPDGAKGIHRDGGVLHAMHGSDVDAIAVAMTAR